MYVPATVPVKAGNPLPRFIRKQPERACAYSLQYNTDPSVRAHKQKVPAIQLLAKEQWCCDTATD